MNSNPTPNPLLHHHNKHRATVASQTLTSASFNLRPKKVTQGWGRGHWKLTSPASTQVGGLV